MTNFLMTPQERLFAKVEEFLKSQGCTVTSLYKGGEYHIHYTLKHDIKPQPALRITNLPSIIIPAGTEISVASNLIGW